MKPPLSNGFLRFAIAALAAIFALLLPSVAQALPEGYVYEKVSPADKGNGEVNMDTGLIAGFRSAEQGDRILYPVDGVMAGATAFPQINQIFAQRGTGSWGSRATTGILPVNLDLTDPSAGVTPYPQTLSLDGSKTVLEANLDPETGEKIPPRVYLVDLPTETFHRLSPDPVAGPPGVRTTLGFNISVDGTDDFSTVFFASEAQLTADAQPPAIDAGATKLYVNDGGSTELASYRPGGIPASGVLTSADPGETDFTPANGVSDDGTTFWWTPGYGTSVPNRGHLYRAEVGIKDSVFVNESENTSEVVPPGLAELKGASSDGNRAVITSQQKLTDDASSGSAFAWGLFLYTHSNDPANDQNLSLISRDLEPADGIASLVSDVLGVSDDARVAYFTADSQLVPGESTDPGEKIFRWEQGVGVEYIATAQVSPYPPGVTPDGRYLALRSSATGITPDDNGGNEQVYLYDSAGGGFTCASCVPNGGANQAQVDHQASYNITSINKQPRRMLSDDGRVIFTTRDALLPSDTNGMKDVYTYKDGQLDLVSSGRSTSNVRFADATADGSRIYFSTRAKLSGWDEDTRADLYVARLGDGLPEPASRPDAPCTGDDCQGPSPAAPGSAIGSTQYEGSGNAQPSTCPGVERSATRAQRRVTKLGRQGRSAERAAKRLERKAKRASGTRSKRLARRAGRQLRKAKRFEHKHRKLERKAERLQRELRTCRGGAR